jgi:RND family efflux transporter MFP subunit
MNTMNMTPAILLRFAPVRARSVWLLSLICLALVLSGCDKKERPAAPPSPVTVAKPLQQQVRSYEIFDGYLAALLSVNLEARVPGYLTKILFKDGAYVKKNDLLFVIEQEQYIQQVKLTQAIYDESKIEFNRQKSLLKENATSQAAVDKALSNMIQAEANLQLAKINLGYTEVKAPFDGLMGRHLIDVGNYLGTSPQGVKLATIQKINPIYVYFSINERDLLKYQKQFANEKNRKSIVDSLPVYIGLQNEEGYPHEGVLDFAANLLSTSTGSLQLRAEIKNDQFNLVPGLYARVMAEYGDPRQSLLIPSSCVMNDQEGAYVYLMDANKKVERRNITLGQRFGKMVEVRKGLAETDNVLINGFVNVGQGQLVAPTESKLDPVPRPGARS